MRSLYLVLIVFFCCSVAIAQDAVPAADLSDSVAGTYSVYSVQTWQEFDDGKGVTYWEDLVVPETLSVWQLTINCNGTFSELEYGKEAGGFYAFNHYGKAFVRTGEWKARNDTLTFFYKEEKVYEDQRKEELIETIDLLKAYQDQPYLRQRQLKFAGNGRLCWKSDYNEHCLLRDAKEEK